VGIEVSWPLEMTSRHDRLLATRWKPRKQDRTLETRVLCQQKPWAVNEGEVHWQSWGSGAGSGGTEAELGTIRTCCQWLAVVCVCNLKSPRGQKGSP
jgi:hypothetical protein